MTGFPSFCAPRSCALQLAVPAFDGALIGHDLVGAIPISSSRPSAKGACRLILGFELSVAAPWSTVSRLSWRHTDGNSNILSIRIIPIRQTMHVVPNACRTSQNGGLRRRNWLQLLDQAGSRVPRELQFAMSPLNMAATPGICGTSRYDIVSSITASLAVLKMPRSGTVFKGGPDRGAVPLAHVMGDLPPAASCRGGPPHSLYRPTVPSPHPERLSGVDQNRKLQVAIFSCKPCQTGTR